MQEIDFSLDANFTKEITTGVKNGARANVCNSYGNSCQRYHYV